MFVDNGFKLWYSRKNAQQISANCLFRTLLNDPLSADVIQPFRTFPANIYLFKLNNRNTRKKWKICSKLTVTNVFLVLLSLTLNLFHTFFYCFYCWVWTSKCYLSIYIFDHISYFENLCCVTQYNFHYVVVIISYF